MKRTGKFLLYGIYALMAVGLFLYLLFPSAVVRELVVAQVRQSHSAVDVRIDEVRPSFPPGLRMFPLSFSYAGTQIIALQQLKVVPKLTSLLGNEKQVAYNGSIQGGGGLEGYVRILQEAPRQKISGTLNVSQLPIENIALLKQISQVAVVGMLTTFVDFDTHKGPGGTADVNIDLSPVRVNFTTPLMGLEQLDFTRIQSDLIVTPRMLQIKQIDATGAQLEARITGSVVFRFPLQESRLNLSCTVKPQPGFVAEQKDTMIGALLASSAAQQRGVIIRIAGTLAKPNYVVR